MNELQWLKCKSPSELLNTIRSDKSEYGKQPIILTKRKLGLLTCALYSKSKLDPNVIQLTEKYLDGEINKGYLNNNCFKSEDVLVGDFLSLIYVDNFVVHGSSFINWLLLHTGGELNNIIKCDIIKCLFGNPFRQIGENILSKRFDNQWLKWNNQTVINLAKEIYNNRQFQNMPILADALLEAGCDIIDIVKHCQGFRRCFFCLGYGHKLFKLARCKECNGNGWLKDSGIHYRGCNVLDIILGKE
jgi:hypothetical protein